MSGKIKLGKSFDSRTRKKIVVETEKELQHRITLQHENTFTSYLLKKGYSTKSAQRFKSDTDKFLQWLSSENTKTATATNRDVLAHIQHLKQHANTQRTIQIKLNGIKHYFNYLKATDKVTDNPTIHIQIKGIKRRILYDILSRQELDSLYHNYILPKEDGANKNQNWFYASSLTAKRNKVILGLIIYQGLNTLELSQLTVTDMKLREGKIFIAGTRRSNERELKLESHQILDLMEYIFTTRKEILQHSKKESEKLFTSVAGNERFNNVISQLIIKLNKQNPKVTSLKQIRTSVITCWLKLYNLRQVQHMAGHRYVSSTESYLVNDLDDLSEDITKYHPII